MAKLILPEIILQTFGQIRLLKSFKKYSKFCLFFFYKKVRFILWDETEMELTTLFG